MEVKGMFKRVSCLALAGLLALSGQALATDTRTEAVSKIQQVDTGTMWVDKVLGYSSNYDLRNYKYLTIQNPGSTNSSWAIVATNLIEQMTSAQYSEKHLDYATALQSTKEGNKEYAYNRTLGSGGNMQLALGYITSGRVNNYTNVGGLVLENAQSSTYSFPWDGNFNKVAQSSLNNANRSGRLESYVKFPSMYKTTYDVVYTTSQGSTANAEDGKLTLAFNDPLIYSGTNSSAAQIIARDASIETYTGGEIEENRQAIKEHIIKYGAVSAQIYRNQSDEKQYFVYRGPADRYSVDYGDDESSYWVDFIRFENLKSHGLMYYCNKGELTPNQSVVIIGWDDEKVVPGAPGRGAYLVMDPQPIQFSYATRCEENGNIGGWYCNRYTRWYNGHEHIDGRCWGWINSDTVDTNFYYVSYYDYYIESNVYGLKSFSTGTAGKTYQHDDLGISTSFQPENSYAHAFGANVFDRNTTLADRLDAISIASMEPMKYEVYVNPKNGELKSENFIKVAETEELDAGYNTIYLEDTIMLTGDQFAVAVKYISTDTTKRTAKIGVQSPTRRTYLVKGQGDSTTTTPTIQAIPYWSGAARSASKSGISWAGTTLDNMTDLYKNSETQNMIICIKAYTTEQEYKIPPESVKIQKISDLGIYEDIEDNYVPVLKGDQAKLSLKILPEDSDYQNVTWSSSNRNIASVDSNGIVTALEAGSVTITASVKGAPAFSATCTIDVRVPIESFVLNKNNVTILAGETNVLAGIFGPEDATTTKITWATSNKQVVKVTEDGLLIGLKQGTAIVTATVKDENGTHTATCKVTVPESLIVDVLDVSLNKTSLTLQKGTRETLKATVTPADATNTAVVWTSSNKNVAIVNANGRITALSKGTAVITVTTVSGGETATCNLTVTEAESVAPTGITLNQSAMTLQKDDTAQLVATVLPTNADDKTVLWESSDLGTVRVDNSGKITARTYGTAIITAKTIDGKYSATCTVTVEKPVVRVTGVTINKTAITLENGAKEQLIAAVEPPTADNSAVTWTTSNENVVQVDGDGNITVVGYGTATITVTTVDGGYTKTCVISVPQTVNVTGIELSAETLTIKEGRTAELIVSILPADATNTNYTQTISDETIIKFVGEGITGLKVGEATITFETEDGKFSKTCTVKVEAVEETDITISSKDYIIDENDEITNVAPDTTTEDLKENITTDGTDIVIKDKDGNVLENTDNVGTGSTIEISKEIEVIPEGGTEPEKETITEVLTIKISGDVNGDGKVSSTDLSILKQYIMEEQTLEGIYLEVADINGDGDVSLTDLSLMKQQMVSLNETEEGVEE